MADGLLRQYNQMSVETHKIDLKKNLMEVYHMLEGNMDVNKERNLRQTKDFTVINKKLYFKGAGNYLDIPN